MQRHRHDIATREQGVRSLEIRLAALKTQLAEKDRYLSNLEHQSQHLTQLQHVTAREVSLLKRSWSYRVGRVIVRPGALLKTVYRGLKRLPRLASEPPAEEPAVSRAELIAIYERLTTRPLFSIVTPVYNTPAPVLREALQSVCQQVYQEWELCLVDDGSSRQETLDVLAEFQRSRAPAHQI